MASCGAVRVGQVETAKRLAEPLISVMTSAEDNAEALAPYEWRLVFNDMEFSVYPIAQQGRRTIFANASGLKLTWDGESLIFIEGMPGAFGYYEQGIEPDSLSDAGSRRWYARAGWPVLYLDCAPQRDWRLTPERAGWRQECEGELDGQRVRSMHSVERDVQGAIREIRSTLWPLVAPLRLYRLRNPLR